MNQLTPAAVPTPEPMLTIGSRVIPSRYFLAPLAGYTQLPFRRAVRELGGLGLATTDLVQAIDLVTGKRRACDIIVTSPDDAPLSVQIFGSQISRMVEGARWLEARGYRGVDINMGCPMAKINGQGGGARLLCDVDNAVRTAAAVVEAVRIPVTVKMRLGWDRRSIIAPTLAREFEQVGIAAITIHGRTRSQGFGGDVQIDAIRETVAAVKRIPVIGNGDVRSVDDAIRMRQETGCAAVAIGRGVLLDPWIFRKLAQRLAGETDLREPTAEEQIAFLVRHLELMHAQHDQYACRLFRKFAGWYGARLGVPEDLEDRLRRFESIGEFHQIVEQIRERHGERSCTTATALIKVPNGPVEKW